MSPDGTGPTMPGAATPDMDPVTWPRQTQARDLTGHGRRLDITTTSHREDTEPMNDITDPIPGPDKAEQDYYRARGVDAEELLMRVDFARFYRLRDEASKVGTLNEYSELIDQADTLAERWRNGEDPVMAHKWEYLTDATDDWQQNLKDIRGFHEELELNNFRGEYEISPDEWRSQQQARALTGGGRWPDTATTETQTEQQMRADFMHAQDCHDYEDYDPADALDYGSYANRWVEDPHWIEEWIYLQDATHRALDNRDPHAPNWEQNAEDLTPMQLRSEEQGRYIAEHGIERDQYGFLTSHYVTRVENRDHDAAVTPSPLANYRSGNALADHAANREHDGTER